MLPSNRIKIILVEPAGALNVGSVARLMKNMGFDQLWLVNPHCDPLGEEARLMAVHALDILQQAQTVPDLPTALQGCQRAIATTARERTQATILETPRQALPWLVEQPTLSTALIFGPEERGLSNQELNYAQRFVKIPVNPAYAALNLAQAVAICVYELYGAIAQLNQGDKPSFSHPISSADPNAPATAVESITLESLERFYQQLEQLLLKIGYLYPHTAAARMQKLRRLFNQANLNAEKLAMLQGILRQMDWASQSLPSHQPK